MLFSEATVKNDKERLRNHDRLPETKVTQDSELDHGTRATTKTSVKQNKTKLMESA